ncbi:hypothetical protein [Sinomonas sp. G460-2]|uniref:hypothetical protein n=1 Tax=Sinomonas sp. G460-2 TaxID=3393464 RepID=UPI0039F0314C
MATWHSGLGDHWGRFRLKLPRRFSIAFVVGILLGSGVGVAQAEQQNGDFVYFTSNGIVYMNQSIISNDVWPGYADTWVYTRTGQNVLQEMMGDDARSYVYDGVLYPLCSESGDVYGSSTEYSPQFGEAVIIPCGAYTYYSKGQSLTFNGTYYDRNDTYPSPVIWAGG